jgi:chlorite dismutase
VARRVADALQEAYGLFRRTALGRHLAPVWSQMALHRPAEFNKSHLPAFLAGEEARAYICVYPFVRSYEWYLLPDEERRAMLAEHGKMARGYPDVRANTVASFALGDYEWMLAFEADELHRIVDLMRDLRASRRGGTCARRSRSTPAGPPSRTPCAVRGRGRARRTRAPKYVPYEAPMKVSFGSRRAPRAARPGHGRC